MQLFAGLLCIHHVFVDDVCGALCVCGHALADLARTQLVSPEDAESYNIPDRAELAEELEEFLSSDVVATSRSDSFFSIVTFLYRFFRRCDVLEVPYKENPTWIGLASGEAKGLVPSVRRGEAATYRLTSGASFPPRLIS